MKSDWNYGLWNTLTVFFYAGGIWHSRINPINPRRFIDLIRGRASDIDFQLQLEASLKLKSLTHFNDIMISTNGLRQLNSTNETKKRKIICQALLNCPGSMVFRERGMKYCSNCASALADKNIFVHRFFDCKSIDRSKSCESFRLAHHKKDERSKYSLIMLQSRAI